MRCGLSLSAPATSGFSLPRIAEKKAIRQSFTQRRGSAHFQRSRRLILGMLDFWLLWCFSWFTEAFMLAVKAARILKPTKNFIGKDDVVDSYSDAISDDSFIVIFSAFGASVDDITNFVKVFPLIEVFEPF